MEQISFAHKRGFFFAGLVLLCLWLTFPLWHGLAWGVVLGVSTYRLFLGAQRVFAKSSHVVVAAFVATAFAVLLPLLVIALGPILLEQIEAVGLGMEQLGHEGIPLPAWLRDVPLAGPSIAAKWDSIFGDGQKLLLWFQTNGSFNAESLIGGVAARAAEWLGVYLIAMFTVFFIYRDGKYLVKRLADAGEGFMGPEWRDYLHVSSEATHAVMSGSLIMGGLEGALLGITYATCDVPAPLLFGLLAGILTIIPGATAVLHTLLAILVLYTATASTFSFAVMVACGVLILGVFDNLMRPRLIGNAVRTPFYWVMVGLLGGGASLGVIGLFIGPVVLAVTLHVWRHWLDKRDANLPGSDF